MLSEPSRKQAGMIVGYGVESLLPQSALADLVAGARRELEEGDYVRAFEKMVGDFTVLLKEVSQGLPRIVGLPEALVEEADESF